MMAHRMRCVEAEDAAGGVEGRQDVIACVGRSTEGAT